MCSAKHLKSKFDGCVTKLCKNQPLKTFPIYFSRVFLQHFSSRSYSIVKVILANILNSLPL